ncbi:Transposon Ty3-G Gag-Pol polyprotein [Yarrowia sp. E02]|nr:Transposon Ty3-G Gag-Pol polyprotein [Yarrowia sp. E02]
MDSWMDEMKMMEDSIKDLMVERQRDQEKTVNRKRSEVDFDEKDLILVHRKAYFNPGENSKMHDVYFGPYRIRMKKSENVYDICLPPGTKKHTALNVKWLKKYNSRGYYLQDPPVHEDQQRANLASISKIAGIDENNQMAYVTWSHCDPEVATPIPMSLLNELEPRRLKFLTDEWNSFFENSSGNIEEDIGEGEQSLGRGEQQDAFQRQTVQEETVQEETVQDAPPPRPKRVNQKYRRPANYNTPSWQGFKGGRV